VQPKLTSRGRLCRQDERPLFLLGVQGRLKGGSVGNCIALGHNASRRVRRPVERLTRVQSISQLSFSY